MTVYSVVLFLHIVAVFVPVSSLSLETAVLFRLQQAVSSGGARLWIDPAPGLSLMGIGSLAVLLISGGDLTARMSGWILAWPKVAVATLILIALLGAISGRRMRAIRRPCLAGKTNDSELTNRLRDPILKVSLGIRIALGLGAAPLMTAKPGLWVSIIIVGASVVLGLLSSLFASRRPASLSAASPDLGD
jgi:hypothetical protein